MRQLFVQVPRGHSEAVVRCARSLDAINIARWESEVEGETRDLVLIHLSNAKVEAFLREVEPIPELHVSFFPQGVLALKPPPSDAPQQVVDVEGRSPIEVFLAGHQSIGSWSGFLSYAAAAGAVTWIGLFTGSIYLLTAAMLIAPFAGPAMNTALATASGNTHLLGRSLLRYGVSLAVAIAVTAVLTLAFGLQNATSTMTGQSQVSVVAALLPLVAGAAGAVFLTSSDRSSLVSGASVGILVAASLAPPAGLVGMAGALGRWDLVTSASFLLALQLVGINLSGAVVFRAFGLSGGGARYETGWKKLFPAGLAITGALLAALLVWQFTSPFALQQASIAERAAAEIEEVVGRSTWAEPVEVQARFTRSGSPARHTLLSEVAVRRYAHQAVARDSLEARLGRQLREHVRSRWPSVTPLVDVRVFDP